ncbi:hypothetical protein B5X24_HaOG207055 [Helicoverpa armigera]|uniref:Uncharacterized protein n=1 Tax=Helicoverpa armigera TaxID=29058 RepID=A0A2W1BIK6_HELAM|nr:hypothetical protein B5X24_HaOG207055 [Helicoverpa armigera]
MTSKHPKGLQPLERPLDDADGDGNRRLTEVSARATAARAPALSTHGGRGRWGHGGIGGNGATWGTVIAPKDT